MFDMLDPIDLTQTAPEHEEIWDIYVKMEDAYIISIMKKPLKARIEITRR